MTVLLFRVRSCDAVCADCRYQLPGICGGECSPVCMHQLKGGFCTLDREFTSRAMNGYDEWNFGECRIEFSSGMCMLCFPQKDLRGVRG